MFHHNDAFSSRDTVLITGASTGIGLALAKQLIQLDEFHLILTAKENSLSRFQSAGINQSWHVWLRPLDVTDNDQRVAVIDEIDRKLGGVDILINNAGYMLRAVVEHVSETERLKQMDINFRAPIALTRQALPQMRSKKRGQIINVSSVGGMMAMPTMAVYSASKFALEGATEALWYEVKPWNIKVSLIEIGMVNSSGFKNVKQSDQCIRSMNNKKDPYYEHYNSMTPFIAKMMTHAAFTPEKIAKRILKTISQSNPPLRVAGTPDAFFFSLLRRFLPRRFYHWMLYRCLPNISHWGEQTQAEPKIQCPVLVKK